MLHGAGGEHATEGAEATLARDMWWRAIEGPADGCHVAGGTKDGRGWEDGVVEDSAAIDKAEAGHAGAGIVHSHPDDPHWGSWPCRIPTIYTHILNSISYRLEGHRKYYLHPCNMTTTAYYGPIPPHAHMQYLYAMPPCITSMWICVCNPAIHLNAFE
ncbi:hypothetical protein JB92DRAFT_2826703 [Gautieria morchelliformis]|nr:hypothetical protein JB92DRAFT_2826703 [Gautieria morchelliformis]